jgi:uncharacterized transporter YbjL
MGGKSGCPAICSRLAGASTNPPLAFTLQPAGTGLPSLSYAAVYPLIMIARIIAAALPVLFFA